MGIRQQIKAGNIDPKQALAALLKRDPTAKDRPIARWLANRKAR